MSVNAVTSTYPLLDNWRLMQGHLTGAVLRDPDHADGETIHTNELIAVVKHRRVRTRDREYQLGTPDPAGYGYSRSCTRAQMRRSKLWHFTI
jgi:hypothetical protein